MDLFPPLVLPTVALEDYFRSTRPLPWESTPDSLELPSGVAPAAVRGQQRLSAPSVAPMPLAAITSSTLQSSSANSISSSPASRAPNVTLPPKMIETIMRIVRSNADKSGQTSFVDRMSMTLGGTPEITIDFLRKHGVTLRQLVDEHDGLSITDLKCAGLIRSLADMLALGFTPMDLCRENRNFSCSQCAMLLGVTNTTMRVSPECKGGITMMTLLQANPRFKCQDLLTLQVTAELLIKDAESSDGTPMHARLLAAVGLTMQEWIELGLTRELLQYLRVTKQIVARDLKWSPERVEKDFGMPPDWT